jgi:hypothetical protein
MALLDRMSHGYVAMCSRFRTVKADVEDYKVLIPTWLAMVSTLLISSDNTDIQVSNIVGFG